MSSCTLEPRDLLSHLESLYMQTVLLPLKKPGGKSEKNFKRPQARANGAPNGQNEQAKPAQADPGIERSFTLLTDRMKGLCKKSSSTWPPNLGCLKLLAHAARLLTPGNKLVTPGLCACMAF